MAGAGFPLAQCPKTPQNTLTYDAIYAVNKKRKRMWKTCLWNTAPGLFWLAGWRKKRGQNCVSFVLWVHDWGVLLLDDGQKKGSSIILQVQYFGYSNSPRGDEGWVHACMLSCFSRVSLFGSLWTVTRQAPLYRRFSRQEYRVAMPSSRGSSRPRDQTCLFYVSCIGSQVLYH